MSPVWVPADVVPVLDLFYWPVSRVRRCPAVKLLLKFTSQQRWHYITHTSPTNRSRNFPSFVYEVSLFISLNIFHEIGADKHAITIAVNFSVNALINYSKISENCLKIYCQNQINIPNLWILIVDVYNPCLVRRLLVSSGLSFLWSRPHKKAVNKIDRRLRFSECWYHGSLGAGVVTNLRIVTVLLPRKIWYISSAITQFQEFVNYTIVTILTNILPFLHT